MNNELMNNGWREEQFPGDPMVPIPEESCCLDDAALQYEVEAAERQNILPDADCTVETLPSDTESKTGKKTLKQADLVSMWKYMLSRSYAN